MESERAQKLKAIVNINLPSEGGTDKKELASSQRHFRRGEKGINIWTKKFFYFKLKHIADGSINTGIKYFPISMFPCPKTFLFPVPN